MKERPEAVIEDNKFEFQELSGPMGHMMGQVATLRKEIEFREEKNRLGRISLCQV